jgi:D-alanyl-D-alanine carboxypeptidase
MVKRCVLVSASVRGNFGYGAVVAVSLIVGAPGPALAHYRHHHHHFFHAASIAPPLAAMVVDANSGRVLYAHNENELRHPASITKVMTLYLLFEQLEKGRLRLDSPLRISEHAADQAPSRLGLEPGETITVENAIKAVVTKSANDIAVAIAENITGDEDSFAEMMTHKAHALGMAHTQYRNASGLPNDEQLTTAADLAILGRAIQERFPRYSAYFSTRTFYFAGAALKNHNHLLGRIDGVDGIKTGYTRASGFNLLTSVRRSGRHIVAVVLGGRSAAQRDRMTADLVETHIARGATTVSVAAVDPIDRSEHGRPAASVERVAEHVPASATLYAEPSKAVAEVKTDKEPFGTIGPNFDRPRPAVINGGVKMDAAMVTGSINRGKLAIDGSTNPHGLAAPQMPAESATPPNLRWVVGPPALTQAPGRIVEPSKSADAPAAAAETNVAKSETSPNQARPAAARSGWMVQIGATDDVAKANALLARAKTEGHGLLTAAEGFTEKVQKGDAILYRARFAGLDPSSAEAVCKSLKKSGFACFPTKN